MAMRQFGNLKNIGEKLSDFEEIPNENKQYCILGRGNYAFVEKMKSKRNNKIYAIKKIDKNANNFSLRNFRRETEILYDLNHENIIKLYGYFEDKENINKYKENYKKNNGKDGNNKTQEIYCLVLEYVPSGTLENYFNRHKKNYHDKNSFNPLKQGFIIRILKQLLDALKYLQENSIIHRDIKPDNILIDENNDIKISDFGLATLYPDNNPKNIKKDAILFSHSGKVGRRDYICPEMEKGKRYDFRADIFSLGLTMISLMSYDNPIKLTREQNQVIRNIDINGINETYDEKLKNLVLKMIDNDINERPTSIEIYDELIFIENHIKNPNYKEEQRFININQNILNNVYNQQLNNQIDYSNVNQEYFSSNNCRRYFDSGHLNNIYLGYMSRNQINNMNNNMNNYYENIQMNNNNFGNCNNQINANNPQYYDVNQINYNNQMNYNNNNQINNYNNWNNNNQTNFINNQSSFPMNNNNNNQMNCNYQNNYPMNNNNQMNCNNQNNYPMNNNNNNQMNCNYQNSFPMNNNNNNQMNCNNQNSFPMNNNNNNQMNYENNQCTNSPYGNNQFNYNNNNINYNNNQTNLNQNQMNNNFNQMNGYNNQMNYNNTQMNCNNNQMNCNNNQMNCMNNQMNYNNNPTTFNNNNQMNSNNQINDNIQPRNNIEIMLRMKQQNANNTQPNNNGQITSNIQIMNLMKQKMNKKNY